MLRSRLNVILLVDYQGRFGSKDDSLVYRAGMDLEVLSKIFSRYGISTSMLGFAELDFRQLPVADFYLYTSQEDAGYEYKDFIEDVVLGLSESGAKVLPEFKYLRANNNKVFMEILRDHVRSDAFWSIRTFSYGALEEFVRLHDEKRVHLPSVVKTAGGSGSVGVSGADTFASLGGILKRIMRTKYFGYEVRDVIRSFRHRGYKRESLHRRKVSVQNMIVGLANDWKILVFGTRFYVFQRPNRKGDFRASGSGHDNYLYNEHCEVPEGMLDFAEEVFGSLSVPNLSMDVGFDGSNFHLIEFQALYFGSVGHALSDRHYYKEEGAWHTSMETLSLEEVYVDSVVFHINTLPEFKASPILKGDCSD